MFAEKLVTTLRSQLLFANRPGANGSAPDLGYRLYYGSGDQCVFDGLNLPAGASPIDVGQDRSVTLIGLTNAGPFHFSVTAYDHLDRESPFFNQVPVSGGLGDELQLFLSLITLP